MKKIKWYLKQCLPLTYTSRYRDGNGIKRFSVWMMWFGKVFNHKDVAVRS